MARREPEPTGYRNGIPIGIGNGFQDAWQRGDVDAGIGAAFAFVDLDDAPGMVRNAAYAFGITLPRDRAFDRVIMDASQVAWERTRSQRKTRYAETQNESCLELAVSSG